MCNPIVLVVKLLSYWCLIHYEITLSLHYKQDRS